MDRRRSHCYSSAKMSDEFYCHEDPYRNLECKRFNWRANGRKSPPPFTALLFTLSHATELIVSDGQFSSNNYCQRLAQLTGFDA